MSSSTAILTATSPSLARRNRVAWLGVGLAILALAVAALAWPDGGARLVLGAAGAGGALRGVLLARASGAGLLDRSARPFGVGLAAAGLAAAVVAVVSAGVSGAVLVVGVPLLLLFASGGLLVRPGLQRRGGQILLAWTAVVVALLVAAGVSDGWSRAVDVAGVVGALALAVAGVAVLVGAGTLPAAPARPASAAYPAPAGCGGCACGAGGCGGSGG